MNKIFERVIITISVLLVLVSSVGLYFSWTQNNSRPVTDREVVGNISSLENNVKRKTFGNFSWDNMDSGAPVFFKDVIFVSPKSTMKLTLADKTELTVGENTLLVLDNKLFGGTNGKFEVTELRLIRGQVSVKQPEGSNSKPMQLVLNDNVKFDLRNNAALSLSKMNDKASVVFDKGNVTMSGKSIPYAKPTLINDIDLTSKDTPDFDTLTTQEVTSVDPGLKDLPVVTLDNTVTTRGDIASLDGQLLERRFSTQNKRKIAETLTDANMLQGVGGEPRNPAAVDKINLPASLPEKIEPLPTPVPEVKKVRLPVALIDPEDKQLFDLTKDIKSLSFSWESKVNNVHFYMVEISSDKKFTSVLTRIAVENAEGRPVRTEDGRRMAYELKVSPFYMLYVPGLLGSIYKSKEIYWRVVPLDGDNTPLLRASMLESRRIAFKVSKNAEIFTRETNYYTKETAFGQDPILAFQWTFKHIVPGSYQLIISEDPDFKTSICVKEVAKYNFKKGVSLKAQPDLSGQASKVDLNFNEDIKLNTKTECALDSILKAEKTFYYKIISFDPADQKIPYNSGKGASGKFIFK